MLAAGSSANAQAAALEVLPSMDLLARGCASTFPEADPTYTYGPSNVELRSFPCGGSSSAAPVVRSQLPSAAASSDGDGGGVRRGACMHAPPCRKAGVMAAWHMGVACCIGKLIRPPPHPHQLPCMPASMSYTACVRGHTEKHALLAAQQACMCARVHVCLLAGAVYIRRVPSGSLGVKQQQQHPPCHPTGQPVPCTTPGRARAGILARHRHPQPAGKSYGARCGRLQPHPTYGKHAAHCACLSCHVACSSVPGHQR